MSIVAIPFAVDINKVKAAFGSCDHALLAKIKTANLYDHYADFEDDSLAPEFRFNFDDVLRDIIFNWVKPENRAQASKKSFWSFAKKQAPSSGLDDKRGFAYGYALLVMCDYFGVQLLPESDGFYYGRAYEAAVSELNKHGLKIDLLDMVENHQVFDIPWYLDFPSITSYTLAEVDHIAAIANKTPIDDEQANIESDEFDEVQSMLYDIRYCFNECKKANVEMVVFTH